MQLTEGQSDDLILEELGKRIAYKRLERGLTQAELAREAGLSKRTLERVEAGASTQLANFVRILRSLGLLGGLELLLPESPASPIALLALQGKARKRASARPAKKNEAGGWTWGDEE